MSSCRRSRSEAAPIFSTSSSPASLAKKGKGQVVVKIKHRESLLSHEEAMHEKRESLVLSSNHPKGRPGHR